MVSADNDAQVFNTVLEATLPDLLRYLVRRVQAPEAAADLLSDSAVIIWSKRAKAPADPEAIRMWMFVIARNALRTHWRSERRRTEAATALSNELRRKEELDVGNSLEKRLDVRRAIARLPPRLREPLILVHWDGFTLDGAARHLGVNPSTLRSRYSAARAALAKDLNVNLDEKSESGRR